MLITYFMLGFLISLTIGFRIETNGNQDCILYINKKKPEPIITEINSLKPLYPVSPEFDITIPHGSTVLISCPGHIQEATCILNNKFYINSKEVYLDDLHCNSTHRVTSRYTNKTCEGNGREIEVGFKLDLSRFVRTYMICFDDKLFTTLYSHFTLTRRISSYKNGVNRPNFYDNKFFSALGKKLKDLYSRKSQRKYINILVGLNENSTEYIKQKSDYFLSKGHLTAKSDFVYANQQKSTFQFVNVVPQWQSLNSGNWQSIEKSVQIYATKNKLDLDVYTGTYGVANLPSKITNDTNVQLFLYVDDNNNLAMPVPEILWKLLYNPLNNEHIVLLSLNNPYEEKNQKICNDISDEINWINWKKDDQKKGFSYACNAYDLRDIIPHFPALNFGDILT